MRATSTRILRSGFIAATIAASGAFLATAPANAEPFSNPLLTSTCTFAQVEAAARTVAPEFAAQLDRNPIVRAQLQAVYVLPPGERAAVVQRALNENPLLAAQQANDPQNAEFERISVQIADTCNNY